MLSGVGSEWSLWYFYERRWRQPPSPEDIDTDYECCSGLLSANTNAHTNEDKLPVTNGGQQGSSLRVGLCLKTAWAGLLKRVRFAHIRPLRLPTGMTIEWYSMTSASVSAGSSPCTSVTLNRECRLGLASKKLYRALIIPRVFRSGSICVIVCEVEHMSVTYNGCRCRTGSTLPFLSRALCVHCSY